MSHVRWNFPQKRGLATGESCFQSVKYRVEGRVAHIFLNRPKHFNAIDQHMPGELEKCVQMANDDNRVHVIVLGGEGEGFCGGYDLKLFAEKKGKNIGVQSMPWDPTIDYKMMRSFTDKYMSLFYSYKPTIAKVHGHAVAGGSDIALCCDLVVMATSAKIGYPPARVWGIPTTSMWVYRLGMEKAKRMLFTGDLITGQEAKEMGLVLECVDPEEINQYVDKLAARISSVPQNQLMMSKLAVNHVADRMGLNSSQTLSTFFDGIARHSPEGVWFKEEAELKGFKNAVHQRDCGEPIAKGRAKYEQTNPNQEHNK
eukprot:Nk52_evm28s240 gene=Nk52_evmTU28s240